MDLRHGYTLADVDRIARSATRNAGSYASNFADRYDLAYSAVVEALYSATEPPADHSLFDAGCNGIWRALRAAERSWGLVPAKGGGQQVMPAFDRYWVAHAPPTPSPEQVVVEAQAARQIWPKLTDLQREALSAYAAHGRSLAKAAAALGLPEKTLSARVDYARAAFLRLWHEGETPSRKWRKEGTRRPDTRLVPCGSDSAYFRHRRRREPIDEACRRAHADYVAECKARRRERAAA